jgi:signal transduction histidine kinase
MKHRQVVIVPDIAFDDRIPHEAYQSTFVKSLCMVPIREQDPIGAIGTYWSTQHIPSDEEIKLLQILANTSATAFENLELRSTLDARNQNFEFQLHSLAHDLKSPMATVMGLVELLQMKLGHNQGCKELEYVSSIQRVSQKVIRQIDSLLKLYKYTRHSIQKEAIDLSKCAEQIVCDLKTQEPQRRIEASIEQNLIAYADSELMTLVLENLLSNAVKYSRKKDSTFIRFGRDPEFPCAFVVEDHGDGFDPTKANQLFQPFVRLHNNRDFDGTGLGLASVARILELHGGFIRAEGQPSKGARFIFSLPEVS